MPEDERQRVRLAISKRHVAKQLLLSDVEPDLDSLSRAVTVPPKGLKLPSISRKTVRKWQRSEARSVQGVTVPFHSRAREASMSSVTRGESSTAESGQRLNTDSR
jgi:hypothetical protein